MWIKRRDQHDAWDTEDPKQVNENTTGRFRHHLGD